MALAFAVAIIGNPDTHAARASRPERSVSTSRQFIVYGPDAALRGALCDVAERVKRETLRRLQQADGWRTPVVVNAQFSQAHSPELPPARLNFSQTGFGLKLQLDLTLNAGFNPAAVERELLRALLLEMMYREQPDTPAGTPYVEPPEWLLEGLSALAHAKDSSAVADRLSTAAGAGGAVRLEDFLRQKPALLDSPSQALYRTYAAAFVSMLTRESESRLRFARFIAALPQASNDPLVDLQQHFPALGDSPEKAQKGWELNVKRLASTEHNRLLNCEETERQLVETLRIEVAPPGKPPVTYALEEFPQFIRDPAALAPLRLLGQRLLVLSGRAHALYQPVLREYQQIALLLEKRKPKRVAQRLAEARSTREQLGRRMTAIGDYMNWFEATQSRTASGAFREYMKAAEAANDWQSRRRDPISVYLDAMEAQF